MDKLHHRWRCAKGKSGKTVRYRDYYDRATLLQQLDLLHLLPAVNTT